MEKAVRDLFSPSILQEALARYAIAPGDSAILDGFESFIYNVHRADREFILRIGHDSRRPADQVRGEAEFLNHLAAGGLSVPQVLPSQAGNLVEPILAPGGSHFVAALFEKAPGHPVKRVDWGAALFRSMGGFMGRMHRLSRQFQPSQPRFRRLDIAYDMQQVREYALKALPPGDEPVLRAYDGLCAEILALPQDAVGYGLAHIDFHSGNFFITDEGRITLFDFDDCQYAWYVYDIAMALFYVLPHHCTSPGDIAHAETFLAEFWAGYQATGELDPAWLQQIPLFLRLRELDLYIIIHRSMDIDNLDPWCASFMKDRRQKILTGTPYCPLDFSGIG